MKSFGSVLTKNDKYLILFAGEENKDIYILDIYKMDSHGFIRSKLKCPFEGPCYAVLMDNTEKEWLTVYGWIREQDIHCLNQDVIGMICRWYSDIFVHLIKRNRNKDFHYKVALHEIFQ